MNHAHKAISFRAHPWNWRCSDLCRLPRDGPRGNARCSWRVTARSRRPFLSPLAPERDSKGPASPNDESRSSESDLAKPAAKRGTASERALAGLHVAERERDLTGLAEAIAFYKAGDLAHGDIAAATAKDTTVRTALEWIALRSFPRETGFERLQAFMQAHPVWPALDWLKKRSEEALFGDRKSSTLIKTFFSGADPETPAGKLALARVLTDDGKTSEAAALVRAVWREADLNPQLEAKVKTDFNTYLSRDDHKFRADRLLYKKQIAGCFSRRHLGRARCAGARQGTCRRDQRRAKRQTSRRGSLVPSHRPGLSIRADPQTAPRRENPRSGRHHACRPTRSLASRRWRCMVDRTPASRPQAPRSERRGRSPTRCAPNIPRCRAKCGSRQNFTPAGSRFASLTIRCARPGISTP